MGVVRLAVCVSGVYATFLLWAIAQERLSKPFPRSYGTQRIGDGDKFPSHVFLNFSQSLASGLSAVLYLFITSIRDGALREKGWRSVLGIEAILGGSRQAKEAKAGKEANGISNGNGQAHFEEKDLRRRKVKGKEPKDQSDVDNQTKEEKSIQEPPKGRSLLSLLLQVALCQTLAGPIGFSSLQHISFPTMVLGKSCKLIPVMLLNVLLYRRRFSGHKYIVVGLVTLGISLFMLLAPRKKTGGSDSLWGMMLLLINLLIDGLTNSTQDQIFSLYPSYTGQQMMAHMAVLSQLLLLPTLLLPLPAHPWTLLNYLPPPLSGSMSLRIPPSLEMSPPAILSSLTFLRTHPAATPPLLAYALLGGMGQLFIFETIQHFGSLTLVMVTVTRKLFTMLLSVVVFEHKLTVGQWAGVAVVFAGIGVEAGMKRRDVMRKARRDKGK